MTSVEEIFIRAVKAKLQTKSEGIIIYTQHAWGVNVMFRQELYIMSHMALACQQKRAAWLTFKIVHQN